MEDFTSIHPEDDENGKNNRYLSQKPNIVPTVVFSLITVALLALSIVSCVFWPPLASGLLFGGTGISYLITSKIYSSYSGKKAFYKLKKMNKKLKNPEVSNYLKEEENNEKEEEKDVNSKKDKTKENDDKNEKEDKNIDDEDDKETTYEEDEDEEQEKIKNNGNSKLNKRKINEKIEKTK